MHRSCRSPAIGLLAALTGCLLAGGAVAAGARTPPEPCPAARYLVVGEPIAAIAHGVQLGPATLVDDLCGSIAPKKRKANRKGVTRLVAKWPQCNGLTGAVSLRGKIVPGCARFEGTLKAKRFKRKFEATLSACGDGVLDEPGGEVCDDGNQIPDDGCEPDCLETPSALPTTTTLASSTTASTPLTTTTTSTSSTTASSPTSSTTSTTVATVPTTTGATTSTTSTSTSSTTTTSTLPETVLGLEMVAGPDPVVPGGLITYELTATNQGPAEAVQAELRMTLPNGTLQCGAPSDGGMLPTGCAAARDVVWTLGTMAVGASRTVQIVVQIRGDVVSGTDIVATARLNDAAGSPEATAQATVVVETAPALGLVLTTDANPVEVGDEIEYVLRFGNRGVNALLNTQLVLTLPAGTSVLDAGGGVEAAGTIAWSLGAVNAGQTGERRVRVQVEDLAPDDPLVRVAGAAIASGAVAAHTSVVTEVQPTTLGLALVGEPEPLAPAGLLTYHLTATNHGATDAQQVELRLTLPVGTFDCGTPSDGGTFPQPCGGGRDVLWNLGTLGPGTSRSVQLTIQIRGDVPTASILSTTARVRDGAGARARAGLSSTVVTAAPLSLVLSTDADPAQVGDDLEYVLRFGNRGANALLNTQLVLTLPGGTSVVDPGGGTAAAGAVTWSLGALNAAQTGERRVRVHLDDLAPDDPRVRVAHAAITSGAVAARTSVVTTIEPTALGLELVAEPEPVAPAGLLTYHVTATNHGATDAEQVELRLTLPVGIFQCGTPSDGGTLPPLCSGGRDVLWALGTLGPGTSRSVQLTIQIRGDVPAATILSTTARIEDAGGARARAGLGTTVATTAPLSLVLTAGANPVPVGDEIEYVLRFGNRSAGALLNAQLALTLPAGTSVVDDGGGTPGAGMITWPIGTLDPAVNGERRVRVHVDDLAPDDPRVRVAGAAITSGAAAARAAVVTEIQPTALGLELVAEPDPVPPAGLLTYRLTVTNHGMQDAVQVELRLTLPVGIFDCATPSDGGTLPPLCSGGRDVLWALGTLGPGTSRSVQQLIQVRADVPAATILSTTARVQDVAGSRAHTGIATAVQTVAPLSFVLTTVSDPVLVGEEIEYVLRFGNRGASGLMNAQLALTLPAGTSVVDDGGGTESGGTITWALGTLDAATNGERRVRVQVEDLGADDPLVRVARAVIASGTAAARAGVVTQVQPSAFGLTMAAAPDPVAPAGLLTYQLTVNNQSGGDAVQVELRMTLPVGIFGCGMLSDGGQTPQGCFAGRDVLWSLGTMAPGAMKTVQAVIQIRGDVPSGSILSTTARVQDVAGSRARAALSTGVD